MSTILTHAAVPFALGLGLDQRVMPCRLLLVGALVLTAIFGFFGFVYAHFTAVNHAGVLLGVGFSFGTWSWIFLNNLFSNSNRDWMTNQISHGAAFWLCMIYGLGLYSVKGFEKITGVDS